MRFRRKAFRRGRPGGGRRRGSAGRRRSSFKGRSRRSSSAPMRIGFRF